MIFDKLVNRFHGEPMLDPRRIQRKTGALVFLGLGIASVGLPVTFGLEHLGDLREPLRSNYDYYAQTDARLTVSCRSYLRDAVAHAIDPEFMKYAAYNDPACARESRDTIDGYTAEVGAVAADETAVNVTKGANYAGLGLGVLSVLVAGTLVTVIKSPNQRSWPTQQLKTKQKNNDRGAVGFVSIKTNDHSTPVAIIRKDTVFQPFADNPNPIVTGTEFKT